MNSVVRIGLVCGLAVLAACGGKSAATASGDSTGVAACDEYIAKVDKCLAEKVPAAQRDMLKQASAAQVSALKQTVQSAGKDAAEKACVAARDAARQSYGQMGCTDF